MFSSSLSIAIVRLVLTPGNCCFWLKDVVASTGKGSGDCTGRRLTANSSSDTVFRSYITSAGMKLAVC